MGKETVAKERVRMDTETHRDEEQVSDEVRKEQIEATDETAGTARGNESATPDTASAPQRR